MVKTITKSYFHRQHLDRKIKRGKMEFFLKGITKINSQIKKNIVPSHNNRFIINVNNEFYINFGFDMKTQEVTAIANFYDATKLTEQQIKDICKKISCTEDYSDTTIYKTASMLFINKKFDPEEYGLLKIFNEYLEKSRALKKMTDDILL